MGRGIFFGREAEVVLIVGGGVVEEELLFLEVGGLPLVEVVEDLPLLMAVAPRPGRGFCRAGHQAGAAVGGRCRVSWRVVVWPGRGLEDGMRWWGGMESPRR